MHHSKHSSSIGFVFSNLAFCRSSAVRALYSLSFSNPRSNIAIAFNSNVLFFYCFWVVSILGFVQNPPNRYTLHNNLYEDNLGSLLEILLETFHHVHLHIQRTVCFYCSISL